MVLINDTSAEPGLNQARTTVKPEQHLSDAYGNVKVSDFGFTRIVERDQKAPSRLSPFTAVMFMPNAAAGIVAGRWGLRGESSSVVAACASGTGASSREW